MRVNIYIIGVAYILINMALLIIAPYDVHLTHGADASSWYDPALSLLKHGEFVTLEDTSILQTYRTPIYPIYEALMLFIGKGNIISIIVGQITILWFIGIITYKIVEKNCPDKGVLGLLLVVFNPNALGAAHLVQSDILYMLMVTATLYYLFLYNNKSSYKLSFIIGLMMGLTCLVRPSGQYLIPLFPIIYIMIGLLKKNSLTVVTHLYHGLISTMIAIAVVFPWAQHNSNAGWGYNLATAEIEVVYFRDNVIYLDSVQNNKSLNDSEDQIIKKEQKYISYIAENSINMSEQDRLSVLSTYYKEQIFTYDYKTVVKSFIDSWIGLFGAGGAANIHNILALDGKKSINIMSKSEGHVSRVEAVFSSLLESNFIIIAISLLSFSYVIVLRIFDLIGFINLIRNREYSALFILTGIIVYFVLITLFVGNSRYRLPIEPALIILSVYGFNSIFNRNIDEYK